MTGSSEHAEIHRWSWPANIQTSRILLILAVISMCVSLLFTVLLYHFLHVLTRPKPKPVKRILRHQSKSHTQIYSQENATQSNLAQDSGNKGAHLLIVLGSGGHTAEMLSILSTLGPKGLLDRFSRRTYVVSSGDGFSAERARVFEEGLRKEVAAMTTGDGASECSSKRGEIGPRGDYYGSYAIATVHRARKIHQPLYTTPFTALVCLWDCVMVLRGTHPELRKRLGSSDKSRSMLVLSGPSYSTPDLILTNGPGTGVCVVLASLILLVLDFGGSNESVSVGQMRTIYIESWARVKTLSLSGKILKYLVDRFLVQWEKLAEIENGPSPKQRKAVPTATAGGSHNKADANYEDHRRERRAFGSVEYVGPLVN